jgi:hypothetical protein
MNLMLLPAFFMVLLSPVQSEAKEYPIGESSSYTLGGYFKNLGSVTDNGDKWPAGRRYFFDEKPVVRLNGGLSLGIGLSFGLEYETTARWGDAQRLWWDYNHPVESPGVSTFAAYLLQPPPFRSEGNLMDMEEDLYEKRDAIWQHRMDRAWAKWKTSWFDLQAGRLALSWGSALIWNPMDIIAPFSPTAFDTETKPGSDMAVLTVPLGLSGDITAVWLPARTWDKAEYDEDLAAVAARMKYNIAGWDFGLMGGKQGNDRVGGMELSGSIEDAGAYFEATYTSPSAPMGVDSHKDSVGGPTPEKPRDFWRAVAGGSYRWASTFMLTGEVYMNNLGEQNPEDYLRRLVSDVDFRSRLETGQIFNIGRNYAGAGMSYEFTPRLVGAFTSMMNLNDQSVFTGPNINYSVIQDVEIMAGALITAGKVPGEFGGYSIGPELVPDIPAEKRIYAPDSYYIYMKYYF